MTQTHPWHDLQSFVGAVAPDELSRWMADDRCDAMASNLLVASASEVAPDSLDGDLWEAAEAPEPEPIALQLEDDLIGIDACAFLEMVAPTLVEKARVDALGRTVVMSLCTLAAAVLFTYGLVTLATQGFWSGVSWLVLTPVPVFLGRLASPLMRRRTHEAFDALLEVVAATCALEQGDAGRREGARRYMRGFVEAAQ